MEKSFLLVFRPFPQTAALSVRFSRSVVFDSLRPHESQHARPPRPSSTPRIHSNSRPSSQWCHPVISSSVGPFSSCPQPLPASESFPMSQLFAAGGQSTGVSALASFLPENTQDWSPLECTVPRSCPTLCNPTDCSLLGSSVHVILQARILEWIAISSSRGSSWPRDWTHLSYASCISREILYHWATWEAAWVAHKTVTQTMWLKWQ